MMLRNSSWSRLLVIVVLVLSAVPALAGGETACKTVLLRIKEEVGDKRLPSKNAKVVIKTRLERLIGVWPDGEDFDKQIAEAIKINTSGATSNALGYWVGHCYWSGVDGRGELNGVVTVSKSGFQPQKVRLREQKHVKGVVIIEVYLKRSP